MDDATTLQQGLEVFHKKNKKYFPARPQLAEGRAFLESHDVAHVVFGCDTSIYGEGVVKIWTTFGTTLDFWKVVGGYNEVNISSVQLWSYREEHMAAFEVCPQGDYQGQEHDEALAVY